MKPCTESIYQPFRCGGWRYRSSAEIVYQMLTPTCVQTRDPKWRRPLEHGSRPTKWINKPLMRPIGMSSLKAISIGNITSGFRATGICPYDKDVLPIEAFAPSLATEKPYQETTAAADDSEYASDDYLPLDGRGFGSAMEEEARNSFITEKRGKLQKITYRCSCVREAPIMMYPCTKGYAISKGA
ncbi:unnamed protein product [Acanthoscelides obtectus]|uniref:Uncharacterized protein n=1 Tax=Acanthoscelides obtectus TaxID=200917 RepID=A0A9P0LYI5_ACAOB|nr:unnamed protein product [Acanthoscelides obtectus]CAK1621051.1 hypothetical protein AOBTE_LOCUS729 [Acanthoscelides obtectus]